jgi:hypothetical protein
MLDGTCCVKPQLPRSCPRNRGRCRSHWRGRCNRRYDRFYETVCSLIDDQHLDGPGSVVALEFIGNAYLLSHRDSCLTVLNQAEDGKPMLVENIARRRVASVPRRKETSCGACLWDARRKHLPYLRRRVSVCCRRGSIPLFQRNNNGNLNFAAMICNFSQSRRARGETFEISNLFSLRSLVAIPPDQRAGSIRCDHGYPCFAHLKYATLVQLKWLAAHYPSTRRLLQYGMS